MLSHERRQFNKLRKSITWLVILILCLLVWIKTLYSNISYERELKQENYIDINQIQSELEFYKFKCDSLLQSNKIHKDSSKKTEVVIPKKITKPDTTIGGSPNILNSKDSLINIPKKDTIE